MAGGALWTVQEVETLRALYAFGEIDEIQASLPRRNLACIYRKAQVLGLKRSELRWHPHRRGHARDYILDGLMNYRQAHGIGRRELARKLGYDDQMVRRWEHGVCAPKWRSFLDWLDALGLKVELRPKQPAMATALAASASPIEVPRARLVAGR